MLWGTMHSKRQPQTPVSRDDVLRRRMVVALLMAHLLAFLAAMAVIVTLYVSR